MTVIVLFWLNVLLLSLFASLALQPRLLGFAKGGKWYLSWFAVGLGAVWALAGLNILGIRANARVTFGAFIVAAFVLVNLLALGFLHLESGSARIILGSAQGVLGSVSGAGLPHAVAVVTVGVASCILAYSGIESVIQTAGLVDSWRDIARAYWFLALTAGIVPPT